MTDPGQPCCPRAWQDSRASVPVAGAKISPCVPSGLLGSSEVAFSTPCLWTGRGSHLVLSHPVLGPDSWTPPLLSWPYTLLLALSVTVQRPRTRGAPVAPSLGFLSTHGSGPFGSLSERQPLPAHACSDSLLPGRRGLYLTPSKPLSSIDKDSNPQGPHLIVGLQGSSDKLCSVTTFVFYK